MRAAVILLAALSLSGYAYDSECLWAWDYEVDLLPLYDWTEGFQPKGPDYDVIPTGPRIEMWDDRVDHIQLELKKKWMRFP